jgi:hypothetical protein
MSPGKLLSAWYTQFQRFNGIADDAWLNVGASSEWH